MRRSLILMVLVFLLCSCGTKKLAYYSTDSKNWESRKSTSGKKLIHTLFLVGDAGELHIEDKGENFVLNALHEEIKNEVEETSLVYLGDNVYPVGLPKKSDPGRAYAEKILDAHLALSDDVNGKTYFIPGNHDWNKHKKGGLKAIKRQEEYVKENGSDKVKFYPHHGCGDPKVVKVNSDLVYVFIDSQWWLHDWHKEKKINRGCDIKSRGDLLKSMEEIFTDHKNDEIIVMMHHPIKSNGYHGGNFTLKHHLFPLHELGVWLPLPVIGSVYPIYRNVTGSKQDITNIHNQELMGGLASMAKAMRINVVFAAGHEHGLQFFEEGKLKYIVSGGGSKHTYTRKGGGASFAKEATGFAKISFYENFEAWVEFYTVEGFGQKAKLEFRAMLREPRAGTLEEEIKYPPISITDTVYAANPILAAGSLKKAFLGAQYRDVWKTPVKAEVIDLETKMGGLVPIKKGGGQASNSLRMEREDGKQFILRSIKKDYRKLVPPELSDLALLDLMKDQNSASHPYGALIIPSLSKAAGIYYTDPKLVYLKHQRGLGNYNTQFPEELYLLEERPTGDWSDAAQFGYSKKIIGYSDLLMTLQEKKNHFVDQRWVCKSRMFDLLIHDWDRHDDQWRWASFEEDGKTVYRPIPRDRDQAFYKFIGLIPRLIGAAAIRQFQTMKDDVKSPQFLAFNAKHFDRYFMNELEWSEWSEVISELQKNMTDEVIEASMDALPAEVRGINDEELISKLKARRDNLHLIGERLYKFIANEVEITGTDNKDHFEVTRHRDGSVQVIYHIERNQKGELLKYDRTFYPNETKEIRIYGLRGKDEFNLLGEDNNQIKIRFIGGEDDDLITNSTSKSKVYAYDEPTGIKMSGTNILDRTSNFLDANEYDRKYFKYNSSALTPRYGRTRDDGQYLGFTWIKTKFGWRKNPYASWQKLKLKVAPFGNGAINANYTAHFPDAIGKIDFSPQMRFYLPDYENWFGLGNSTENPLREIDYHWVRIRSFELAPLIQANFNGGNTTLRIGPSYENYKVENTTGRVSEDEILGLTSDQLESKHFVGGLIVFNSGSVDNNLNPANGINVDAQLKYLNILSQDKELLSLDIGTQFYVQLITTPKLVFANNIGYQKIYGDPEFHQYPDLGNDTNLRGYRDNRFRGESVFYHNMDLRMHLFNWNNRILPLGVGVVGGYDYGRVSFSDEDSDKWHSSNTIGLSVNVLGALMINPSYSFTEEGDSFNLDFGYSF